jgi:TetR/AcrR family tetracycline transcriptional repressor
MPLRREEVIQAGMRVLDEVGLDALTTRRLATELGVRVGALYWHVKSKADLLAAMAEELLSAVEVDVPRSGAYEAHVAALALSLRHALLSHRDGAKLVVTAAAAGTPNLSLTESLLETLRAGGASPPLAAYACDVITSYVLGFVVEEQASWAEPAQVPSGHLRLDSERFPNVAECLPHLRTRDHAFDSGLALIMAGLGARVADDQGSR